ncbi:hypothetical protein ABZ921_38970 [Streptomyces atriruber]|uniref:Secreted protein n=1 Tax=Streptomyces atriruber TaxID=545121 RepID=A0ABV3C039_9ACTN
MTRLRKTLAACALTVGVLGAVVTPAMAENHPPVVPLDNHQTVVPPERHQTVVPLDRNQDVAPLENHGS